MGNDHGRPKDIVGEVRQAFTSTADTTFDVCMENQLVGRSKSSSPTPKTPSNIFGFRHPTKPRPRN